MEALVSIGIIVVLIGLITPSVARLRQQGRSLTCLAHVQQLETAITSYTIDFKGFFPSIASDSPSELITATQRNRYIAFPTLAFQSDLLSSQLGLLLGNPVLSCPSNQTLKDLSLTRYWVDYCISDSAYLDCAYLNPALSQDSFIPFRARLQRIDDALFPSDKAGVFERRVWHNWRGYFSISPPSNTTALAPRWTSGNISIGFLDGHADQLSIDEIAPSVNRLPALSGQELNLTPFGFRGRDRK